MKIKSLLTTCILLLFALHSIAQLAGSFTDLRDGTSYKTVTIGTQTWMAENMAYKTPVGCWAFNDSMHYVKTYGYLYNWEAAKKVCPDGWHLPDANEWDTLLNNFGGKEVAGGSIRSTTGWFSWDSPGAVTTNNSGFTALPAGSRDSDDAYEGAGYRCFWWTSTLYDPKMYWYMSLEHSDKSVIKNANHQDYGYSVRCLKN